MKLQIERKEKLKKIIRFILKEERRKKIKNIDANGVI
jgi:hypothetical protein